MTLYLDGTNGISGVDGSAGTPAIQGTDANTGISFPAADTVAINTGGSERSRVDSSGRLLLGTSSARTDLMGAGAQLQVEGTTFATARLGVAMNANNAEGGNIYFVKSRGASAGGVTVVSSGDTLGDIEFGGADGTNIDIAARIRCQVDGTPGANDMPGRIILATTADGASSPTERMRISSSGNFFFRKTTSGIASTGFEIRDSDEILCTRNDGNTLAINRLSTDGNLVEFLQGTITEGTISVSGSTVAYNGAHLSRWSQIPGIDPHDKTDRPEILRGTVMSNLDEMCDWIDPESGEAQDNEQLNKTKISDVEGDKNVAGVFQAWDDDDDTWVNDYYLAMTGDFIIRIAAGTTVERGDLLMSAGDGTAKPQDDDIIRSKTIAKVTSTNVSCTYEDGSYCVPCVLMAC